MCYRNGMSIRLAGAIVDGKIWGRGTADDKFSLFGILEATERLLEEGYQPAQTVYFEFGHDEEKGGTGALAADQYLLNKGIKPLWVLDEGGEITVKEIPGMQHKPVALIGMAEKGLCFCSAKCKHTRWPLFHAKSRNGY